MANKDTTGLRNLKAEELKEEVIKAQSPGPKTAEMFKQETIDNKKEADKQTN